MSKDNPYASRGWNRPEYKKEEELPWGVTEEEFDNFMQRHNKEMNKLKEGIRRRNEDLYKGLIMKDLKEKLPDGIGSATWNRMKAFRKKIRKPMSEQLIDTTGCISQEDVNKLREYFKDVDMEKAFSGPSVFERLGWGSIDKVCECGAKHTSMPSHHLIYCPLNTGR